MIAFDDLQEFGTSFASLMASPELVSILKSQQIKDITIHFVLSETFWFNLCTV